MQNLPTVPLLSTLSLVGTNQVRVSHASIEAFQHIFNKFNIHLRTIKDMNTLAKAYQCYYQWLVQIH